MITAAIDKLVMGESLNDAEAGESMEEIMSGTATPAQISGFLVALRMKGETIEEIAGLAQVMRSRAIPVRLNIVRSTSGTIRASCASRVRLIVEKSLVEVQDRISMETDFVADEVL